MIKALLLIFEPMATWERIVRAQRSLGFVLVLYLLPMILLSAAAEGYGLVRFGKPQGEVARVKRYFSVEAAAGFEGVHCLLTLGVIFVSAKVMKSMGDTFHGSQSFTRAFATVAYGLSPVFLFRLFDAFSWVSPWATWSLGIILTVAILYYGVPRMMEPDPSHAFGLFLMSSLLLVLTTGLLRFFTAWYLAGKFGRIDSLFHA